MSGSQLRQAIFALLTLIGFVWTQYHLIGYLEWKSGEASLAAFLAFDFLEFFASGFVNPGAAFLTVDAIIGGTAFLCWMIPEARKLGMRHWWVYILLTLGVAFAVGFPFFLLMRERRLQTLATASPGH